MQLENSLIKNRRLLVILLLLMSNMVLLSVLQMFGYDFVPCFFDFYQETFFGLFMKKAGGTRYFTQIQASSVDLTPEQFRELAIPNRRTKSLNG